MSLFSDRPNRTWHGLPTERLDPVVLDAYRRRNSALGIAKELGELAELARQRLDGMINPQSGPGRHRGPNRGKHARIVGRGAEPSGDHLEAGRQQPRFGTDDLRQIGEAAAEAFRRDVLEQTEDEQ